MITNMAPRPKTVSTAAAARIAGMTPAAFNRAMQRERDRGRDYRVRQDLWPDGRTPRWDENAVRAWAIGTGRAEKEAEQ